jgi:hypothetical protein
VRQLWSQTVSTSIRGISVAREKVWLLVWDAKHNLFLLNHAGERQAETKLPGELVAACAADDGRSFVAVGSRGQVWFLAPDFTPLWERSIDLRPTAAAIDCLSTRVAVAAADGGVCVFDEAGSLLQQSSSPRPLHHLAFVPEMPALLGAADFGLVVCFDRLGGVAWRDAVVVHIGGMAVSGDGATIALGCFSDGICCYSLLEGPRSRRMVLAAGPCRFVATSYAADTWVTIGLEPVVTMRRSDGTAVGEITVAGNPVGIAVNPMGTQAVVATAEGTLLAYDLTNG